MNINLQNAALAVTAGKASQFPRRAIPQVALIGRSNVGKSSLINTLLGRKALARVSSAPGKTITVNFYDVDGKLYLVDWEYSGMNEAMWDLSCLSIEANYSERNDTELLNAYCGRESTVDEKKRFIAAKLYVDYLWTLWGLTRVSFDGQFMQDYADERYSRLKKNIETYRKIK